MRLITWYNLTALLITIRKVYALSITPPMSLRSLDLLLPIRALSSQLRWNTKKVNQTLEYTYLPSRSRWKIYTLWKMRLLRKVGWLPRTLIGWGTLNQHAVLWTCRTRILWRHYGTLFIQQILLTITTKPYERSTWRPTLVTNSCLSIRPNVPSKKSLVSCLWNTTCVLLVALLSQARTRILMHVHTAVVTAYTLRYQDYSSHYADWCFRDEEALLVPLVHLM